MARKRKGKYRSAFEKSVGGLLEEANVSFRYEDKKDVLKYTQPATKHMYTPDFVLPNGIIVETKGRLTLYDRQKMVLVREQHPDKDIRFVFQRAKNPIRKGSKTTYAMWAEKNGFQWAEGSIPQDWIDEKPRRIK